MPSKLPKWTQEARVTLGYASSNSCASFVLSKLSKCFISRWTHSWRKTNSYYVTSRGKRVDLLSQNALTVLEGGTIQYTSHTFSASKGYELLSSPEACRGVWMHYTKADAVLRKNWDRAVSVLTQNLVWKLQLRPHRAKKNSYPEWCRVLEYKCCRWRIFSCSSTASRKRKGDKPRVFANHQLGKVKNKNFSFACIVRIKSKTTEHALVSIEVGEHLIELCCELWFLCICKAWITWVQLTESCSRSSCLKGKDCIQSFCDRN